MTLEISFTISLILSLAFKIVLLESFQLLRWWFACLALGIEQLD